MEYDTSAEKDEFHKIQMEKFTVQAKETIEAQRHLYLQKAGKELRRKDDAHGKTGQTGQFPRGLGGSG